MQFASDTLTAGSTTIAGAFFPATSVEFTHNTQVARVKVNYRF
jgi:hypothetical protein